MLHDSIQEVAASSQHTGSARVNFLHIPQRVPQALLPLWLDLTPLEPLPGDLWLASTLSVSVVMQCPPVDHLAQTSTDGSRRHVLDVTDNTGVQRHCGRHRRHIGSPSDPHSAHSLAEELG